jgi:sulfite reductase alpha subunit-like flavoprotein
MESKAKRRGVSEMADSNPQLTAALESLEKRLETPIVPGELSSWVDQAVSALDEVSQLLKRHITENHPKQLNEILVQDKGLAARVEQLQEADIALVEQLVEVRRIADVLRANSERLEPDEAPAEDLNQALVDQGLQLIIEIRKQESAISTWYLEAFHRDRGVVD